MKKEYWIALCVIVGVVIIVWLLGGGMGVPEYQSPVAQNTNMKTQNAKYTTKTTKPVTATPPATPTLKNTFTSLFPQRGNYQCDYTEVSSSQASNNVIYFSDGKMRAEFRSNNSVASIMLYDGVYMYKWTEGSAKATISTPKSISDFPAIIPKDFTTGVVLGSGLSSASWSCHAWLKDASKLVKPSYLTF